MSVEIWRKVSWMMKFGLNLEVWVEFCEILCRMALWSKGRDCAILGPYSKERKHKFFRFMCKSGWRGKWKGRKWEEEKGFNIRQRKIAYLNWLGVKVRLGDSEAEASAEELVSWGCFLTRRGKQNWVTEGFWNRRIQSVLLIFVFSMPDSVRVF